MSAWILARRTQITAAVLAVAAGVLFLSVFPFAQKATFAFGDVQEALKGTKSVTYQCTFWNGKDNPLVLKAWLLGGDRARGEFSDGETQIINRKEEAMMTLSRPKRTAVIQSLYRSSEFSKSMTDWFTRLRNLPENASRHLVERTVEGRKLVDFLVRLDERDYKVTVDAKTKLPIRMEFGPATLPGSDRPHRELLTDFVFDAPLPESLFALVPPPGYSVQRLSLPKGTPPDDRSLVISPETGIGPVRFGMTQEEIVKLLGKPDQSGTSETTMPAQTKTGLYSKPQTYVSTTLNYDLRGFNLNISRSFRIAGKEHRGYGLLSFRVYSDLFPTIRPFQGKTKEGIRLGASLDDVLKVYGKPDSKIGNGESIGYSKRGWGFQFRHGKLSAIDVSSPLPADQLRSARNYADQSVPARRK